MLLLNVAVAVVTVMVKVSAIVMAVVELAKRRVVLQWKVHTVMVVRVGQASSSTVMVVWDVVQVSCCCTVAPVNVVVGLVSVEGVTGSGTSVLRSCPRVGGTSLGSA